MWLIFEVTLKRPIPALAAAGRALPEADCRKMALRAPSHRWTSASLSALKKRRPSRFLPLSLGRTRYLASARFSFDERSSLGANAKPRHAFLPGIPWGPLTLKRRGRKTLVSCPASSRSGEWTSKPKTSTVARSARFAMARARLTEKEGVALDLGRTSLW